MPEQKQPNILVIWGDDIGISNLSIYTRGLMGYQTPNIDRIGEEGMVFTDHYGEQSCTAGRAAFITGQSVFRTGLSKVGMPGAALGLRAEDPTIAELLSRWAMPQDSSARITSATRTNSCRRSRLRRVLRQPLPPERGGGAGVTRLPVAKDFPDFRSSRSARRPPLLGTTRSEEAESAGQAAIEDTGPLTKKRMETVDDEIVGAATEFIARQHQAESHSSSGSTRPTCTSGRTPSRRASVSPGVGSPSTTT